MLCHSQVQAELRTLQKMLSISPPGSLSTAATASRAVDAVVPNVATPANLGQTPNVAYGGRQSRSPSFVRGPSSRQQPPGLQRAPSIAAGGVGVREDKDKVLARPARLPTARQVCLKNFFLNSVWE